MPTCLCSAVNPPKFYRFFRGKISKPFLPDWPWYFKQGPREEQTSPSSQGSVSICICCPSKAQPHSARREAKMTGAMTLSIPAPACDYLQLQVAPNYVWSLKHLTFYVIPRTNSFLETFLRDKGTKTQKALDTSVAAKEEPAG